MATLRNEETAAGREIWRKVDEAATRAPNWVRDHISTLVAQRSSTQLQPEKASWIEKHEDQNDLKA